MQGDVRLQEKRLSWSEVTKSKVRKAWLHRQTGECMDSCNSTLPGICCKVTVLETSGIITSAVQKIDVVCWNSVPVVVALSHVMLGLQYIQKPTSPDAADITHQFHLKIITCFPIERKFEPAGRDPLIYTRPWLMNVQTKDFSLTNWDTHTHTCPVSCVIHFTGIVLSKAINECAVRIARTAFAVIWLPPVCCCAANMWHSASQLAQNQAGPTDYRIQRFSYSQQNVLDASRRWKHWKLTHEICSAHLCQKFSFL